MKVIVNKEERNLKNVRSACNLTITCEGHLCCPSLGSK